MMGLYEKQFKSKIVILEEHVYIFFNIIKLNQTDYF